MLHRRIAIAVVMVAVLSGCSETGGDAATNDEARSTSTAEPGRAPGNGKTKDGKPSTATPPTITSIGISHRGAYDAEISENGVPALENAVQLHAEMAEFDIRPTSDGGLVVMHDGGLSRTTDCEGQVWARTLAEIQQQCRLGDGSPVPSLRDFIATARRGGLPLMIELKMGPGWTADVFSDLRESLDPLNEHRGSVFLSFDDRLLALAHDAIPELPGIWIVPRRISSSGGVLDMPVDGFLVDGELTTAAWVARAHRHDKLVYSRVVDTTAGWEQCTEIGMDGVLTNHVADYLRWRDDH
ncbi:hypothetical protein F0U44_04425 [Nocardioides humilatus]|uniref:GP-PDE domain-containing protein n=1 Tax=Nocardioides humilatus TaxID=2607660 RepID=A0A5B1LPP7_9ACTN|nr:glycerophosphodiester phosphodiesterase family protein [Nocardioides humilatus]KAA1421537.1 hypothetical protein F0U44_04425 [Nocardioides humilatus]